MGFTEKIDALDLLIEIIKDHEGELNNILNRLEEIVPDNKSYRFPATVRKWGNSKGAYIPKSIWEIADLDVGDFIDITIRKRTHPTR